jgi:hypothetical protein
LRVLESSLISVPKIFNCNWPMTRSALLRNDMSDGRGDASAESRGTKIKGRVEKLPDRLLSLFMMTFQAPSQDDSIRRSVVDDLMDESIRRSVVDYLSARAAAAAAAAARRKTLSPGGQSVTILHRVSSWTWPAPWGIL